MTRARNWDAVPGQALAPSRGTYHDAVSTTRTPAWWLGGPNYDASHIAQALDVIAAAWAAGAGLRRTRVTAIAGKDHRRQPGVVVIVEQVATVDGRTGATLESF